MIGVKERLEFEETAGRSNQAKATAQPLHLPPSSRRRKGLLHPKVPSAYLHVTFQGPHSFPLSTTSFPQESLSWQVDTHNPLYCSLIVHGRLWKAIRRPLRPLTFQSLMVLLSALHKRMLSPVYGIFSLDRRLDGFVVMSELLSAFK